ncbi:hypothetical protein [Gracilibacillus phocaeensis]|uniref:hypothetical protein n=1 Tax=Gracilibacillus phocaeensis TaxID=2042304 RepID=UPI00103118D2|nr:hypothetical protein [Gracilibacillus phocaeensis]
MYIKEVAASLYPWDLHDEGVDNIMENLQTHANVNSVYLVGIMHNEKRPLRELYYPHNPNRKFYIPEDSRVYYNMDLENFKNTPLKPMFSNVEWLKDTDWLDKLTQGARKHGLKVGSEISHTTFDSKVMLEKFPHLLQRNVKGELVGGIGPKGQLPCPNSDDVREYIKNLFYDTCKNHDIDFIQSCMVLFKEGKHLDNHNTSNESELSILLGTATGGCFCDHCKEKAIQKGYDWDTIVHDLDKLYDLQTEDDFTNMMEKKLLEKGNLTATGFLLENPSLHQWLKFRQESITSLFKDIYEAIKSANDKVEFRYNTYLKYPETAGLSFSEVRNYVDSIRESDYCETIGTLDALKAKEEKCMKIRKGIGYEKDLIASIDVRPNRQGGSNEDIVKESTRALTDYGIDGISLGHYDEATFGRLKAIKQGMEEGEIEIQTPSEELVNP